MSLSILNSLEFKKKVLNRIKESYGNQKNVSKLEKAINSGKGESLFKADIDRKTESLHLISEQVDRKLAEEILKFSIEELDKELDKKFQSYSVALSLNKENKEQISSDKKFIVNIIEKPNSLENPVKPKRKLIITISAISAMFLGVFVAFVVEWWNYVRIRRIDKGDSSE